MHLYADYVVIILLISSYVTVSKHKSTHKYIINCNDIINVIITYNNNKISNQTLVILFHLIYLVAFFSLHGTLSNTRMIQCLSPLPVAHGFSILNIFPLLFVKNVKEAGKTFILNHLLSCVGIYHSSVKQCSNVICSDTRTPSINTIAYMEYDIA